MNEEVEEMEGRLIEQPDKKNGKHYFKFYTKNYNFIVSKIGEEDIHLEQIKDKISNYSTIETLSSFKQINYNIMTEKQ